MIVTDERIKQLELIVRHHDALWSNWLRGKNLPEGIGDVRKYQERIKRLETAGDELIDYLKHRIKTDPLNPIWHTASIKWGKVKNEFKS
jgi:hypothetical protein